MTRWTRRRAAEARAIATELIAQRRAQAEWHETLRQHFIETHKHYAETLRRQQIEALRPTRTIKPSRARL